MHDTLAAVYRAHRRELYVCALSVTGCPQQAEDAIHDAFVRLFALGRPPRRLKAYVFRSVRNAAIDIVRSANSKKSTMDTLRSIYNVNHHPPQSGFEVAQQTDRLDRLTQALSTLDASHREVIILHCNADLRFREIATILGRPMGTVTSWYRRGIEQLHERLKES